MFKSKGVRRTFVVVLLIMLTITTGLHAVSIVRPADDPLLKILPAESLFCIRVNHFEHTIGQVDQFLAGVSPMPMGLSILVRMQLAKVLGSPELNGVNMNGSLAVFGTILPGEQSSNNPLSNIFIGGLVPVSNYGQFISGNPNCTEPDDKGISRILNNGTPILLMTKIDNHALISWANNYDKLLSISKIMSGRRKNLSSSIDIAEAKLSMLEPVWLFGNVQHASKTFEPLVMNKIEEIKSIMKNTGPDRPGAPPKEMQKFSQNIMGMYADILKQLMKQTRYFSISINPKPNVLNITKTVSAVPGTDMANMFVPGDSAGQNNLLNYLEDGAVMNFGIKMNSNFWKEFSLKSIDLFTAMSGEAMVAEDIEKMKALAEDAIDCLNGPMACSLTIDSKNKPPFSAKYVFSVKDKNKFDRLIERSMQMFDNSSIMDFYKSVGMETSFEIQRDVDRYKNISIDSANFVMKSTDTSSPQGQMINKIYGDGFNSRWGIIDKLCVLSFGEDADSSIRELIDEVQAGKKQMGTEMQKALAILPEAENADFVMTYNLLRWIKMASSMTAMPMPILMPLQKMDIPTKSNIVIAGKAKNCKLTVDIALPKEHVSEMMTAVIMMQQQMKTMMQPPPSNSSGNQMN